MAFSKVDPPAEMPPFEIQRIKDLKCPPPFKASTANVQVRAMNASIQQQITQIEMLEKQVVDLESRYKITFTCDTAPIFNTVSGQEPGINLNGTVTNVNIGINLQPSLKGIVGPMGEQGLQGESGKSTIPGNKGVTGYYGLRGDITK